MRDKDKRILQKILEYINDITLFLSGLSYDSFLNDKKTMSACAFGILQIGELSRELSDDIQSQNPDIPWGGMRGMRNRIAHDYKNIDSTVLWDTVKTSLPKLRNQLARLLENA